MWEVIELAHRNHGENMLGKSFRLFFSHARHASIAFDHEYLVSFIVP